MSDTIDQKIQELFNVVQYRRLALEKDALALKGKWETTCSYPMNGTFINLQTADKSTIRQVAIHIKIQSFFGAQVDKELGIDESSLVNGFTVDAWLSDCKKRMAAINSREKKRELDDLEARLNKIVSPEQRREMELAAIAASLK
jgi:hypothetical protein